MWAVGSLTGPCGSDLSGNGLVLFTSTESYPTLTSCLTSTIAPFYSLTTVVVGPRMADLESVFPMAGCEGGRGIVLALLAGVCALSAGGCTVSSTADQSGVGLPGTCGCRTPGRPVPIHISKTARHTHTLSMWQLYIVPGFKIA